MMEIITNIRKVASLKNRILTAALNLDAYRAASPIIVKKDDKKYIVARHIDSGNLEELRKNAKFIPEDYQIVYFNPYFLLTPIYSSVHSDFMSAMEFISEGEKKILIHQDIPMSLYQSLSTKYELVMNEKPNISISYMYKLSRKEVLEKFMLDRDKADQIALNLIVESPDKKELEQYIKTRVDTRFTTLDDLMKSNGLDAVLCTSPIGVQEITGFGMDRYKDDEVAALYVSGREFVYLFSSDPLNDFGEGQILDSFELFAKNAVGNGKLGIEEQHFPYGWFERLGLKNTKWENAQSIVRQFREIRGVDDLSYYIIVCRMSAYAIDNAATWAKEQVLAGRKITEMDISNKYDSFVQVFKEKNHIPFKVDKYWTGLHSSSRSMIPSFPSDYTVNMNSKALKIDAGLLIKDERGIHHAASDIARTIEFDDHAQKLYNKLESYMINDVIPNIKDGMKGKDIYNIAVTMIEKDRYYFKIIGMIPESNVGQIFNRDVGHVMGKQEPVTICFNKKSEGIVKEGMVCALEYQWSMKGFSIGVEDEFLVGKDRGINFSRDHK